MDELKVMHIENPIDNNSNRPRRTLAPLALLASNCIVIAWALWQKWSLQTIVWVYWTQSLITGLFWMARMLRLKRFSTKSLRLPCKPPKSAQQAKEMACGYFLSPYICLHAASAVILTTIGIRPSWRIAGIALIFIAEKLLPFQQTVESDDRTVPNIAKMLFCPYIRVIPMNLAIVFGAYAQLVGFEITNQMTLALFLGLKTVADLVMYMITAAGFDNSAGIIKAAGDGRLQLPDGRLINVPDDPELAKKIDAMLKLPPEMQQEVYKEVLGSSLLGQDAQNT